MSYKQFWHHHHLWQKNILLIFICSESDWKCYILLSSSSWKWSFTLISNYFNQLSNFILHQESAYATKSSLWCYLISFLKESHLQNLKSLRNLFIYHMKLLHVTTNRCFCQLILKRLMAVLMHILGIVKKLRYN